MAKSKTPAKPRKKLDRAPLEEMIYEVLRQDRHPLEIFTDLDYYAAGADACWAAADRRIKKMPNYELEGICRNIKAEQEGKVNFNSYYDMFNYDFLDKDDEEGDTYYVKMRISARYTACVKAKSIDEAKQKANDAFTEADFGAAEDIDAETVAIEDENGIFVYEK